MLSNQKIINEIKASQRDFINTRPEMIFKPFVNNRAERDYNLGDRGRGLMRDVIGGYKSLGQHPRYSNSINGNTARPDPLLGGAVNRPLYKNYSEFNNRGGALLEENMPLTGGIKADSDFYSESDKESESDEESESDYEESESDYEEDIDEDMKGGKMCKGAGVYDDYIKPAGKTLMNVGKEVFKEVVVPVGKELLKTAIMGLMTGAGKKGGLSGTKKEFIHILKAMYPDVDFSKKSKKELMEEIKKVIPKTDFIPALETTEPRKRGRPKSDKPKPEPKKRGRPKIEKLITEPKEPKKRGRKPKTETIKHLTDLENIFNEAEEQSKIDKMTPDEKVNNAKNLLKKIRGAKGAGIKKIVGTKRGEKVRGDVVAEVMKKHGLNLGQASKYVSEHNLY
jgi:hypothetical protein